MMYTFFVRSVGFCVRTPIHLLSINFNNTVGLGLHKCSYQLGMQSLKVSACVGSNTCMIAPGVAAIHRVAIDV